jgi:hypothetical protein
MRAKVLLAVTLAAAALLPGTLQAQTNAATQINLLAPQLQIFAGSSANFQALALGLTQGTVITIATTTPDGFTQIATFTPPAALSPTDAARALESARQLLITRGITAPTAEQIGVALMGGTLPTTFGTTVSVPGVLTGTISTNAVAVQRQFTGAQTFAGSPANFQALTNGLRNGTPISLTTATGQTVTFTVPGGAMSASDVNLALQLAAQQLALQGIINPTPEQIRAALIGGQVSGVNGAVNLAGILQGRIANTSASLAAGSTSATPPSMIGTSQSTIFGTSNSPFITPSSGPFISPPAAPGLTTPTAPGITPRLGAR